MLKFPVLSVKQPLPPRLTMTEYIEFISECLGKNNGVQIQRQKSIEKRIMKRFSLVDKNTRPTSPVQVSTIYSGSSQWDDIPAKVVGSRATESAGKVDGYHLQQLVNDMAIDKTTWPKGVFRFQSHEEADAWWIENMTIMK